jgi:hypothetical protein
MNNDSIDMDNCQGSIFSGNHLGQNSPDEQVYSICKIAGMEIGGLYGRIYGEACGTLSRQFA